jgi:hypothetical protein
MAGGLELLRQHGGLRPYDSFIQKMRAIEAGKVVELNTRHQSKEAR